MPAGFTSARVGLPSISVVPPLPHVPAPVPSPTVTQIPTPGPSSVPPSSVCLAPPLTSYLSSTVPSNLVAAPSGLFLSVSKGKRTMESDNSSSSKRTKQDVAYVELGFTPSTNNPLHIAHYVAGRLHSDFNRHIKNASWCRTKKGWVRIRFSSLDWAQSFINQLQAFARANPREDILRFSAYLVDDSVSRMSNTQCFPQFLYDAGPNQDSSIMNHPQN
ncbi:hypothetical protein AAF712_015240 [Marasmius tenuissimus]|uniref:Uncharacterized protein n=1 Tax=Marasmius tenuissimus TaxID=585030 RepID=A0ABR2ZA54_9AGAR